VTVNSRRGEEPGTSTLVEHGSTHVVCASKEHFAMRGDRMAIGFTCERCEHDGNPTFVLRIGQHKGNTVMFWAMPA
jgi:hypothetical protein